MVDFIAGINKTLEKSGFDVGEAAPPRWWISTGNYVLNKIISKQFNRGIPQGRLTALTGPAGAGKSYILCNLMREAQKEDCFVVAIDSENALDDVFVTAIGVDTSEDMYTHVHVDTISDVINITSTIIQGYKKQYGDDPNAPKLFIGCDSLDMLITDTEAENYTKKGIVKGDQGQKNKQLKAMLRPLVHAIKKSNITMVVTDQVYKNQDIRNGEGTWIIKDAVQYSLSQIVLITKLKLKNDKSDKQHVTGIKMKCLGHKTRFAQPFQSVTIEVPYETGMDPYNGLLEVAKELGVVTQSGAWYTFNGKKFQSKNFGDVAEDVLVECDKLEVDFLEAAMEGMEEVGVPKSDSREDKISNKLDK